MNYKVAALILLGIYFAYKLLLDWLQFRSLNRPVPDNVKDLYNEEEYAKWKSYTRETYRLSLVRGIVTGAFSVLMILANAYAWVDGLFDESGVMIKSLAVFLFLILYQEILEIPFAYISNFKIEEKYGFNKMTKKTFITDCVRALLIELILFGGLLSLFIWIHMKLGNSVLPLFIVILVILYAIILYLSPSLVKIGNSFQPLPDGELRNKLTDLLEKNGCKVKAINVMDGSKRSTKANAFFSGLGSSKTIGLFDTLLEQMTDDEILAIFAHEMGHNKHKDVQKMLIFSCLRMALVVVAAFLLVSFPSIYKDFGFSGLNYGMALELLMEVCLSLMSPLVDCVSSMFSRRQEYAADRFAKECGYREELIVGLKKLSKSIMYHLNPDPLLVLITYSHPTLSQRIAALESDC